MVGGSWNGLIELIRQLVQRLVGAVDLHLDLAFLGAQHDGLVAQAADHVEGTLRAAAQRQFLQVGRQAPLDDLPQLFGHRKVTIGRTKPLNALVRPLVVVVFHP